MIEAGTAIETVGHTSTTQTTNKIHIYTIHKNITHKHTNIYIHPHNNPQDEYTKKLNINRNHF